MNFGLIQTHPFFVVGKGQEDEYGYSSENIQVMEFEGMIDYIGGNRYNEYMTIHQDATHVIICNYSTTLYELLKENESLHVEDGGGTEYRVLLVDDPGRQAHHLEIEVEDVVAMRGDNNG